jgi:hypothetical protein
MLDARAVDLLDTCCYRIICINFLLPYFKVLMYSLHRIFLNVFPRKILPEKCSLYLQRALRASVNIQVCKEHEKTLYEGM